MDMDEQSPFCHSLRTDGANAKQEFREAHTSDVAEQSLFRRSLRTVGTSAEQGYR